MLLPHQTALPDVPAYRNGVGDLLLEIAGHRGPDRGRKIEAVLAMRLEEPRFSTLLAATPGGTIDTVERLLLEVHAWGPDGSAPAAGAGGGPAGDLISMIEIYLLSQIDAVWWGRQAPYRTDAEVHQATDLVDLDPLRRRGLLGFGYHRPAAGPVARAIRAANRRIRDRGPHPADPLIPRARPEVVALLNQFAAEFAMVSPPDTPPLWITSIARSIEHQHRLRAAGLPAALPSSHCAGYGVDIAMEWARRFHARDVLEALLLERQAAGDISTIDEGRIWHVCLAPNAVGALAEEYRTELLD